MSVRNSSDRYGSVALTFHWLIVVLIITQFSLAFIFSDMPLGMEKIGIILKHKSIGMSIFMLVLLRLGWRLLNPVPALPESSKRYERILANLAHCLLYLLLIAIPLSGWFMSSAAKIPVSYFGWFDFPSLISPDKSLVNLAKTIHYGLNVTLACIVVLHAAAALRHHFVLKDRVLLRMLPTLFDRGGE